MIWQEYFTLNRTIILFVYGQVFFILGLAIFMQSRRHSRLKLARDLRWLALFGVLHGLHEWGLVFIPIQAEYLPISVISVLLIAQVALLAVSFICLLIFGVVMLAHEHPGYWWLAVALVGAWTIAAAIAYVMTPGMMEWIRLATIWARYLLAFPGACLAAAGLYRESKTDVVAESGPQFNRMLRWASYSLLAYGIFAGLIVPASSFFPANLLNQSSVENWLGVPIELFRSLTGLFLMISVIRALEIFVVEVDRLIENMEVEAIQASERDRIGQEIHDGAMQGMYSVGLILSSMEKHIDNPPARERLDRAEQVLEQVIFDLRRYMTSLRTQPPKRSLVDEFALLAGEPRYRSLIDIDLDIKTEPYLEPERASHLLSLVQEALSNSVRHAGASRAAIRMYSEDDRFVLEVEDNGQGFDMSQTVPGFGIRAMGDHARMLDSIMTINSVSGKGTTVVVKGMDKSKV